jgi:hypothetical protein
MYVFTLIIGIICMGLALTQASPDEMVQASMWIVGTFGTIASTFVIFQEKLDRKRMRKA